MRILFQGILLLCSLPWIFCEPAFTEEYTRMGAVAGGNASGEITAFEGAKGLQCPRDAKQGAFLPNPYKDEAVLFRIDHTNVERYKDRLSPGQVARLKRNKSFYMNIYPTHRNNEFLEPFYLSTEKSAKTSRVDEDNILQGYQGGIPFPSPENGLQAIWNMKRPYYGDDTLGSNCRRIVSPSGKVKKTKWTTEVITYDERRLLSQLPNPDKLSQKIKTYYTYPADEAGTAYLAVSYLDDNRLDDTWIYLPTLRRVRRAPPLAGGGQLDGESTIDDVGWEFRGPVNDWHWTLLGRREMYIPVNCYDMWQVDMKDEEECMPGDMNPARLRYELRRVWAVEGIPREGLEHPYGKRVGYYDEDTWQPAVGDRYDRRGQLWRILEFYTTYDYCQKVRMLSGSIYLNLEAGRYELIGGCRDKKTLTAIYNSGLQESAFTVQALRKMGR